MMVYNLSLRHPGKRFAGKRIDRRHAPDFPGSQNRVQDRQVQDMDSGDLLTNEGPLDRSKQCLQGNSEIVLLMSLVSFCLLKNHQ